MESVIKVSNMDFKGHLDKYSFPSTNRGVHITPLPTPHNSAQQEDTGPRGFTSPSHALVLAKFVSSLTWLPVHLKEGTGPGGGGGASLSGQTAGAANLVGGGMPLALCV